MSGKNEALTEANERLTSAVFPLLGNRNGRPIIVGTAFFISTEGIFLTAAHNISDFISEGRPIRPIGAMQFGEKNDYQIRSVARITRHDKSDIAVGVLHPMRHKKPELL